MYIRIYVQAKQTKETNNIFIPIGETYTYTYIYIHIHTYTYTSLLSVASSWSSRAFPLVFLLQQARSRIFYRMCVVECSRNCCLRFVAACAFFICSAQQALSLFRDRMRFCCFVVACVFFVWFVVAGASCCSFPTCRLCERKANIITAITINIIATITTTHHQHHHLFHHHHHRCHHHS